MSIFRTNSKFFPHLIRDNLFPIKLLRDALEAWPNTEWNGWYKYEEARGSKLASNLQSIIPLPCASLLYRMSLLPIGEWLGIREIVPDLGLWGGGLHELPVGCELPTHLDAEIHPRLRLKRAATVSLCINSEWQEDWGGELEMSTNPLSFSQRVGSDRDVLGLTKLSLLPGRLVVFQNTNTAYHGVRRVRGPVSRKTLALFFYREVSDESCSERLRERSLFL
jgi:hypothetical protein